MNLWILVHLWEYVIRRYIKKMSEIKCIFFLFQNHFFFFKYFLPFENTWVYWLLIQIVLINIIEINEEIHTTISLNSSRLKHLNSKILQNDWMSKKIDPYVILIKCPLDFNCNTMILRNGEFECTWICCQLTECFKVRPSLALQTVWIVRTSIQKGHLHCWQLWKIFDSSITHRTIDFNYSHVPVCPVQYVAQAICRWINDKIHFIRYFSSLM